MLSRVADALFWMSRYLERAEQVARLLDVCFHLELDLRGVVAGPYELHWTGLAAILQQAVPPDRPERTEKARSSPEGTEKARSSPEGTEKARSSPEGTEKARSSPEAS